VGYSLWSKTVKGVSTRFLTKKNWDSAGSNAGKVRRVGKKPARNREKSWSRGGGEHGAGPLIKKLGDSTFLEKIKVGEGGKAT